MDRATQQNKIGFLLIGLILGGLFYWYEVRSSNIRKECLSEAMEQSVVVYPFSNEPNTAKRAELQEILEEKLYKGCLSEKGL